MHCPQRSWPAGVEAEAGCASGVLGDVVGALVFSGAGRDFFGSWAASEPVSSRIASAARNGFIGPPSLNGRFKRQMLTVSWFPSTRMSDLSLPATNHGRIALAADGADFYDLAGPVRGPTVSCAALERPARAAFPPPPPSPPPAGRAPPSPPPPPAIRPPRGVFPALSRGGAPGREKP